MGTPLATQGPGGKRRPLRSYLPRGGALPDRAWQARHRGICGLLWVHVVALAVIGVLRGESVLSCVAGPGLVAVLALAASWDRLDKVARSSLATLGLLASSAILIDFFDGLIEAHFHFFVTIAVVSLYQAWRPYLLGVGFVLVHHLVLGTLIPGQVYNHHMAVDHPWLFALVHSSAVLAESVACLVFWRVTEEALDAERANGEALEHSNAELTQANRAVADLVAMLAHDLRVPLTVIVGHSELALESWPEMSEEERLEYVERVSRASHTLHATLDDTLTVSVLDAEGLRPRRVPVRVDAAVRDVLAALPAPPPLADLTDLVAATALVDRGHLDQVLTNLLTNVAKYGADRVAIRTEEQTEAVVVRIADTGPGVVEEFVPHLFERFTRSEDARAGEKKGTGLGLYITRSLVDANDGTIAYEPTPGGGATFVLRLPVAIRPALPPERDRELTAS